MLKQGLNQKLLQKLSPLQIQFIQLLQLNTLEFEQRIKEELEDNPALEKDDFKEEADEIQDEPGEESNDEDLFEDQDLSDYLNDDDDYSTYMPSDPNAEQKEIPLSNYKTLYDHLEEQIGATQLNKREQLICNHLIGMLENDGYLRRPLQNIVYDLAFLNNLESSVEELERLLKIIQSLEPAGIGARNLKECLSIQLERRKDKDRPEVQTAIRIVEKYLDELGNKHYSKIENGLKIDREELKEAVEVIRHLNPKPGETQANVKAQYVTPDFIVKKTDDGFRVSLNARNAPQLNVSREYSNTLKGFQEAKKVSSEQKKQVQFIKQKLDAALWFIESIKQRQNTLLLTMKTIVELQEKLFETGDWSNLKPMVLKDIAEKIEMDISTISRVANSKYVETDFGIFNLREFFSEGIETVSGEEVSNREVKMLLEEIIESEDKSSPLTDEKLTEEINKKGYIVARRTVAKYREQLNIPVARLRKVL